MLLLKERRERQLGLGGLLALMSGVAFAGPAPDYVARGGAGAISGSGGGSIIAVIVVGALFYGAISVLANAGILVRGLLRRDKDQVLEGAMGIGRTFLVLAVLAAAVLGLAMLIGWLGSLFRH